VQVEHRDRPPFRINPDDGRDWPGHSPYGRPAAPADQRSKEDAPNPGILGRRGPRSRFEIGGDGAARPASGLG
jgi:hypothetical protein